MWFDPGVVESVGDVAPRWLVIALAFLSFFGSVYLIAPAAVAAYWFGDRERTGPWLGVVLAIYGLMALVKPLFSLSRPPLEPPVATETLPGLVQPVYDHAAALTTSSFPSGHAMAATIFWLLVALDLDVGSRRSRLAAVTSIIAVVLVSRIVLGVHYVGDVVAGVAIGLVFLGLLLTLRSRIADRTGVTLVVAALFGLGAIALTGNPDAIVVLGGSLGALLARYVFPRAATDTTAVHGVPADRSSSNRDGDDRDAARRSLRFGIWYRLGVLAGCGVLVVIAGAVLVAYDTPVVIGTTAGVAGWLVVATPRLFSPPARRRSTLAGSIETEVADRGD